MKKLKKYAGAALAGAGAVAGSAFAAVDVTSITSTVSDIVTAAATIGAAVLAMHYGIKAYRWLRGAG